MSVDMTVVPPSVRADSLDCIQANLAVLADRWYGPDAHLALGAELTFRPTPGSDGLATVAPTVDEHLSRAARLLGFDIVTRYTEVGVGQLRSLAERYGVLYVVADAYHMPWVPYCGRRHLDHSFLVESAAGATVTDAYLNRTPWGLAEPGWWLLPWTDLPSSMQAVLFEPAASGAPKVTPLVDMGTAQQRAEYVAGYANLQNRLHALDRLTLETWLLARARRLHANFLASQGYPVGPDIEAHLKQWDSLTERTYLALRRVQSGRDEPAALFGKLAELLDADEHVFGHGTAKAQATERAADVDGGTHLDAVSEIVAGVLGVEQAQVVGTPALTDLPSFSSFRVVEIVEALEQRLAIEFEPDDLVPEHLHHLDDLCRLVAARSTPIGGDR